MTGPNLILPNGEFDIYSGAHITGTQALELGGQLQNKTHKKVLFIKTFL